METAYEGYENMKIYLYVEFKLRDGQGATLQANNHNNLVWRQLTKDMKT